MDASSESKTVSLVPIERDGTAPAYEGVLPVVASDVFGATAALYETVGFESPWVCYLAVDASMAVGTCGFKSPPRDGRVEIAYFTFPGFEGIGYATAMAAALVALAQRTSPSLSVAAQTLAGRNASHRVLEKLGFAHVETIEDAEEGTVWEWQLPSRSE